VSKLTTVREADNLECVTQQPVTVEYCRGYCSNSQQKLDIDQLKRNGKMQFDPNDMCECCQGQFNDADVTFECSDGTQYVQQLPIEVVNCSCSNSADDQEATTTTPNENPQHGQNGGEALDGCTPSGNLVQDTISELPFELTFIRRTLLEDSDKTVFEYSVRVKEENASVAMDKWAIEITGCDLTDFQLTSSMEYKVQNADTCLGNSIQFNQNVEVGENLYFEIEINGDVCVKDGRNYAVMGPARYGLGKIPGPQCGIACGED
jgi:hypothetical protein